MHIKLLQTRTTLPCRPGPTSKQQLWKRSIASTTASLAGTTAVHQASHTSLAKGQGSSCLRVIRVTPCSSSLALNVTKSCQCCRISCFEGVQQPPPARIHEVSFKSLSPLPRTHTRATPPCMHTQSHCHYCHAHRDTDIHTCTRARTHRRR